MKKILVVSYYYKHKNAMASVRAIKLAKYFSQQGHDVTVLTSNQRDTWTKNYLVPVPSENITELYAPEVKRWTSIKNYLDHRKAAGQARIAAQSNKADSIAPSVPKTSPSMKAQLKAYLSWQFYFNIAKQEDICMFMGLKEEFIRQGCPHFDCVIATYPTFGAFLMGIWLRKHGYCNQLIADFRDPLYNPGFRNRKQEADYDLKCLNNILNAADQVVCVSKGIADGIIQVARGFNKPISVITNGFDPDDVSGNTADISFDAQKIHFVYTGTLYHGKRCVDMLASVLKGLIEEEKIGADSFAFEYAGPDYQELLSQLRTYGLENTAVDHGFVSREESMAMQKSADALLLLTWNEKAYQGVVPGKLFEYMASGNVPIIALVTGDVVNSEVAQIVRESNTGCACEAAAEKDASELKQYVLSIFDRTLNFNSDAEKYNYKSICTEYLKIM